MFLARSRTGHQDQRWQETVGTKPLGRQQGRPVPEHGCLDCAQEPDLHRPQTCLARLDKAVAVNATARELACMIYTMVTRGTEYVERGMEAHEHNRTRYAMTSLTWRVSQLGFTLVAIE